MLSHHSPFCWRFEEYMCTRFADRRKDTLRKKLLHAITSNAGFDLSWCKTCRGSFLLLKMYALELYYYSCSLDTHTPALHTQHIVCSYKFVNFGLAYMNMPQGKRSDEVFNLYLLWLHASAAQLCWVEKEICFLQATVSCQDFIFFLFFFCNVCVRVYCTCMISLFCTDCVSALFTRSSHIFPMLFFQVSVSFALPGTVYVLEKNKKERKTTQAVTTSLIQLYKQQEHYLRQLRLTRLLMKRINCVGSSDTPCMMHFD